MAKLYSLYGRGQAEFLVLPPPIPFQSAPTSNQTNYAIGQVVYTPANAPTAFYMYGGAGNWIEFATNTGAITSILGTTNQITANTVAGVTTLSLPSAIVAPGSLTTTTTLAATTTVTAGTGVIATTGGVTASAGNIVATLGNISATAGSVSAGTSMTAATTITATLGNITATNGNFVASTAGTGIQLNAGTVSGTTTGTLNARAGQITITTPSIAGGATFAFTLTNSAIAGSSTQVIYALSGGTTGSALSVQSYANTAGQSVITINNGTGATTNTGSLILNFIVVN